MVKISVRTVNTCQICKHETAFDNDQDMPVAPKESHPIIMLTQTTCPMCMQQIVHNGGFDRCPEA